MQATSSYFDAAVNPFHADHGLAARARRASLAKKTRVRVTDGRGHPTTAEMDYSKAEQEFMRAVDAWKIRTGRKFPTLCEILRIAQGLGYEKGIDPSHIGGTLGFDSVR